MRIIVDIAIRALSPASTIRRPGDVAFGLPRQEFCEQRLEPVNGLDPTSGECSRRSVSSNVLGFDSTLSWNIKKGEGASMMAGGS
jgi:hypothetical protein